MRVCVWVCVCVCAVMSGMNLHLKGWLVSHGAFILGPGLSLYLKQFCPVVITSKKLKISNMTKSTDLNEITSFS